MQQEWLEFFLLFMSFEVSSSVPSSLHFPVILLFVYGVLFSFAFVYLQVSFK